MKKREFVQLFAKWNRKIHMYLGLYFILFLWLFSISGLVMNHPKWFPYKVERSASEKNVTIPDGLEDMDAARHLREQLDLKGEIILRKQNQQGRLIFMVLRPDKRFTVNVDRETGDAKITEVTPDNAVILGDLHTFTGVRGLWNEPAQKRDWIITRLWSLSMDALCVGLIYIVISSVYMGFQLKEKRRWVVLSLALGVAACSYFVWGLSLLG